MGKKKKENNMVETTKGVKEEASEELQEIVKSPSRLQAEKIIAEINEIKAKMQEHEDVINGIAQKMHEKQDELKDCAQEELNEGFQRVKNAVREIFPDYTRNFDSNGNLVDFIDLTHKRTFTRLELSKTDAYNSAFYFMATINSPISSHIRLVAQLNDIDEFISQIRTLADKFSGD